MHDGNNNANDNDNNSDSDADYDNDGSISIAIAIAKAIAITITIAMITMNHSAHYITRYWNSLTDTRSPVRSLNSLSPLYFQNASPMMRFLIRFYNKTHEVANHMVMVC